jgi:hypothetical protein
VLAFQRGLLEAGTVAEVDERTELVGVLDIALVGVIAEGMLSSRDAVNDLR